MVTEKIEFIKEAWSDKAQECLKDTICVSGDFIRAEVEAGISELFRIPNHGYIVTRIEDKLNELVLVAAAGKNGLLVLKALDQLALKNGLGFVRMHSQRAGMEKYLKGSGYDFHEKVFKRDLRNGIK